MSSSTDQHKEKKIHLNERNTEEEKTLQILQDWTQTSERNYLKLRSALDIFKDFNC